MSFSDEDIRTIVETGRLSNSEAEEYLVKTLIERRDKVGKYWFKKINPIDTFKIERKNDEITLSFTDLGTDKGLFEDELTQYRYSLTSVNGQKIADKKESVVTAFTNTVSAPPAGETQVLVYDIVTERSGVKSAEKKVTVYVVEDQSGIRIGGIQRQE